MLFNFPELIEKHNLKIKGIIHVGSHEAGEIPIYANAEVKNVVFIEAHPERCKSVKESLRVGRYPIHCTPLQFAYLTDKQKEVAKGYEAMNYAITDMDDGVIELHLTTGDGGTDSIFKLTEYGTASTSRHPRNSGSLAVPTRTLDGLFTRRREQFNMLNIDVEGAELLVLQGAQDLLTTIDYVLVEVEWSRDSRFHGSVRKEEVDALLSRFGFKEVQLYDTGKGWGDVLYVK